MKKIKKSSLGEIHNIHPSHLVDKHKIVAYRKKKGNLNLRPVAIVSEKENDEVSIAQIYGSKGKSKKYPRMKLETTKLKKESYIDLAELDYSKKTNKKFKKGDKPLHKKANLKINKKDFITRENLIKQKKSQK